MPTVASYTYFFAPFTRYKLSRCCCLTNYLPLTIVSSNRFPPLITALHDLSIVTSAHRRPLCVQCFLPHSFFIHYLLFQVVLSTHTLICCSKRANWAKMTTTISRRQILSRSRDAGLDAMQKFPPFEDYEEMWFSTEQLFKVSVKHTQIQILTFADWF